MQPVNDSQIEHRINIFISFSGCPLKKLVTKTQSLVGAINKVNDKTGYYKRVAFYATPLAQLVFGLLGNEVGNEVTEDIIKGKKEEIINDLVAKFKEINQRDNGFINSKFYYASKEGLPFNQENLQELSRKEITKESIKILKGKFENAIGSQSIEEIWNLVAEVIEIQFDKKFDVNTVMQNPQYQEKYFIYCILAEIEFMLVKFQELKKDQPSAIIKNIEEIRELIEILAMTKEVWQFNDNFFDHARSQIDKIDKSISQFSDNFFDHARYPIDKINKSKKNQKSEEKKNKSSNKRNDSLSLDNFAIKEISKKDVFDKIFAKPEIISEALPLMLESLAFAYQAQEENGVLLGYYPGTHGFNPHSKSHSRKGKGSVIFGNLEPRNLSKIFNFLRPDDNKVSSQNNKYKVDSNKNSNSYWKLFTALFLLSTFGFFAYMKSYSIKLQDVFKGKALKVSFNILFLMTLSFLLCAAVYNLPASAIVAKKAQSVFGNLTGRLGGKLCRIPTTSN